MDEKQGEHFRTARRAGVGRSFRLLLVEDEALLGEVLARCFARCGHVVRAASTVIEADVLARDESFDCGVFDVEVGSEDGISLANRLVVAGRVGVAVFFSGTVSVGARRRAAAIGVFVHKAKSFAELLRVVEAQVARGGSA
jgi:DNA-binding response OmpR family regulator